MIFPRMQCIVMWHKMTFLAQDGWIILRYFHKIKLVSDVLAIVVEVYSTPKIMKLLDDVLLERIPVSMYNYTYMAPSYDFFHL